LSESVCTRYGCCKIKTDFVNGVSNFIDRNDLPAQPVLQLYAGHHVTQLVNLLGRVLSRSRNACQFDTGRIGKRLPPVREMEKITRHQFGLLLTMATSQHSKRTCLEACEAPTSLLLKVQITQPERACVDSLNDTKKREALLSGFS